MITNTIWNKRYYIEQKILYGTWITYVTSRIYHKNDIYREKIEHLTV